MQQLALYIEEDRVDLSTSTKLQFKWVSEVCGVDKVELSRTNSFTLPLTPHNRRIFGFADNQHLFASPVRSARPAMLFYAGGSISGILKVTGVKPDSVSASFIWGDLSPLKTVKDAGKISDYCDFSDNFLWCPGSFNTNALSNFSTPYYESIPGSGVINGWRFPQVKVNYLLSTALGILGANVSSAVTTPDYRLILNTMNDSSDVDAGGTITSGYWDTLNPISHNYYLNNWTGNLPLFFNRVQVTIRPVPWAANLPDTTMWQWRCHTKCRIRITGTNPDGYASITTLKDKLDSSKRYVGWLRWPNPENINTDGLTLRDAVVEKNIMKDCVFEAEFEVGDILMFAGYNYNDYPVPLYGNHLWYAGSIGSGYTFNYEVLSVKGTLQYSEPGGQPQMGVYALQPNLPSVTASDLLKLVASLEGKVLVYKGATNTFDLFDLDFDGAGGNELDINQRVVKVQSVTRKAFDFGQRHTIALKNLTGVPYAKTDRLRNAKTYVTPNQTITEETGTELEAAGSASWAAGPNGPYLVSLPCQTVNDQGKAIPQAFDNPVVAQASSSYSTYLLRAGVKMNFNLSAICQLSTQVEVVVKMKLYEFFLLDYKTRVAYQGGMYFILEATFSGETVTLKLQRYK